MENDSVLRAIADLKRDFDALAVRVSDHEKKLRWITSAALFIVGLVGGPNAISLITGNGPTP